MISKIGMIAVNDGIILRNQIPRILKKHFRGKPYYVDLLELFNEVWFYPQLQFGIQFILLKKFIYNFPF